ncbi:unnamed protein product [Cuscuta campestris]|uniref:Retrotransposon gag domain-containing protein n=1 Tax=Cuscuta campestris TaxID=132261 RepID=A0A484N748_9ASTE|nr:unnamed protein product [Cuscuta campestris]
MNMVNTPEESDEEEEVPLEDNSSNTVRGENYERGANDFKVDIEGKNDPDDFLVWLETVERVFDFKDVPEEKKVKIVALNFWKYASTWWSNLSTKRRRENKAPVKLWLKMRSFLKKKFLPEQYVRDNFARLQHLRQGPRSVEDYTREFEELLMSICLLMQLRSGLETTRVNVELNLENQVSISEVATSFDSELESKTEVIVSPFPSNNNMATLRELAAPDLQTQPMSITYAVLEKPLKLNSGFLNMLPKFHGLHGEDPYRHVNEFLITCAAMEPEGVPQEQIRLRAFPFSVMDRAKDWLYYMPPGSFITWPLLHMAFLEEFFPASRIGSIRKDICGIKQMGNESFSEYWKRFNKLCASCPQHQISEQLLI